MNLGNDEVESSILSRGTSNTTFLESHPVNAEAHNALEPASLNHRSATEKVIYCAWSKKSGLVKVGVSNDPKRRVGEVRREYKGIRFGIEDLILVRAWHVRSKFTAFQVEAAYKGCLQEYAVLTEWFELSPENVDYQMDVFSVALSVAKKVTVPSLVDAAEAVFSIRVASSEAAGHHRDLGRCYPNKEMFDEADPLYAQCALATRPPQPAEMGG